MSRRPAHHHAHRLADSTEDSEVTSARSETSGYDSSASERDEDNSGSSEVASSRASKKRRLRVRKHRNKRQKKSTHLGDDNSPDVPSQESVRAPELVVKILFASWGELESYLSNYSKRTYPLYSVRTETPVKTRNDRIKKNQTSCKTISEELEFYNKMLVYTHPAVQGAAEVLDSVPSSTRGKWVVPLRLMPVLGIQETGKFALRSRSLCITTNSAQSRWRRTTRLDKFRTKK
ncbi:hypothetical protein GN958_ATG08730 [Phytophthora infestans]|uniref:Uncharacterized protein n=1 Tax=Phytophthora infestans TaxID=4787 RepID=A0A8S9UMX4_PHYIN|nr:hypothetical protein GN958_ATG08730 [Phytophthora infestans]